MVHFRPPIDTQSAHDMLTWLIEQVGCQLNSQSAQNIIERLQGIHAHLWQEDGGYHVLVVGKNENMLQALTDLAQLEDACPGDTSATLSYDKQGTHFHITGPHAFIYARLFLALMNEKLED